MPEALDIGLTCHPRKDGGNLVFDYELQNRSGTAIYAADAFRMIDAETRLARADDQIANIMLRGESDVVIGKFLPPVPPDREVVVPVVPLTVLVDPGAAITRSLVVRLPLVETTPLVGDLSIREYDMLEIQAVVLTIGYWPIDVPGLAAVPTNYAPDRMQIMASDVLASARMVQQRFPTRGLVLFKRRDAFPRMP